MGGLDWAGFPLMVMKFGVEDVEGLIERLCAIKAYRPAEEDEPQFRQ
jgi:hypothetical protein